MRFDIYNIPFNEQWLLPKMIEWYREKLQGHEVNFIIYDNESTDDTRKVAEDMGCRVIHLDTEGEMRDDIYTEMFNNMWKGSEADFVILVCTDEFIDINPDELEGYTVAMTEGYNMIGHYQDDFLNHTDGVRSQVQDKAIIFSPKDIVEMMFTPGAHYCNPIGDIRWTVVRPKLYHMNMISKEWFVGRCRRGRERMSTINKQKGWGAHYGEADEDMERLWEHAWTLKQKVR